MSESTINHRDSTNQNSQCAWWPRSNLFKWGDEGPNHRVYLLVQLERRNIGVLYLKTAYSQIPKRYAETWLFSGERTVLLVSVPG